MNILILGPQGSGKGTQARLLAEKFNLYYFESGAFLREISKDKSELKQSLDRGEFIPDEKTFRYVTEFLESKNLSDNIIFDGFPRSVKQFSLIKEWLKKRGTKINFVIVLEISEKETIRRLSARRMDPKTGKIYNLITSPPGPEVDKKSLIIREDDKSEVILKRLDWYKSVVTSLIDELSKRTVVIRLNGERPIQTIYRDIIERIESKNAG